MYVEQAKKYKDILHVLNKMEDDKSEFIENKDYILDAFREGLVYIQRDEKFNVLPSIIVTSKNKKRCELIWVYSTYRRNGLATRYITELNIEETSNQTNMGKKFFEKFT